MEIETFDIIKDEFVQRAHDAVWCAVSTVDRAGRPRSRVLHPIWEGNTGWIGTRPQSHKAKHLANNPYVSLAYIKDPLNPVYVDCKAEWVDEMSEKQRIWDLFKRTPEPLGYDPAQIFNSVDDAGFGLLKLAPWRIELYTIGQESRIWRSE